MYFYPSVLATIVCIFTNLEEEKNCNAFVHLSHNHCNSRCFSVCYIYCFFKQISDNARKESSIKKMVAI